MASILHLKDFSLILLLLGEIKMFKILLLYFKHLWYQQVNDNHLLIVLKLTFLYDEYRLV
jgi:hypothetical protein